MILINPGTLPTASALHGPCRAAAVTADTTLRILRDLMRQNRTDDARQLLNAFGFDWRPSKVSDLDLDVAAVVEALEGE